MSCLKIKGGDKIALQLPKIITYEAKNIILKQIASQYPITEPVIDVLIHTIDNKIEAQFQNTINNIANKASINPSSLSKDAETVTTELAHNITYQTSNTTVVKSNKLYSNLKSESSNIVKLSKFLEYNIKASENAQVQKLITQLRSQKKSVRNEASQKLTNMGDKLTQNQVNQIVYIMRHDNKTYREYLYREHHCVWYEYTKGKYYAAQTLTNMNSTYVTNSIKTEARNTIQTASYKEKITDPGWV